ncbi:MAG: vitamin K epoxide reductase [Chloroflexales bacterium]|nr:vitamin K epoxide reductase [Chloroflexales bacterium]
MPRLFWRHTRHVVLLLILVLVGAGVARAAGPVARAVLFFSPTCPHCHYVLEEVLPPLQTRYGEQLEVQLIDVTQPEGQSLYQAAVAAFAIPEERMAVPTLVFDTTVLVGSDEIPAQLPGLIEAALAAGGNTWPAIPGLDLPADGSAAPATTPALNPFQRDPLANSLALALLLGMVASVVVVAFTVRAPLDRPLVGWRGWAVPLLAIVGMAIAVYLATVEVKGMEAACGPVGDCNAVQQSPYARLFGVLPVGVLGVLAYGAVLGAWALHQYGTGRPTHWAGLALPVLAFGGTLFSIYLTFLEPFVIGATCMWCLSSAALMTALLWITAPRGQVAIRRGRAHPRVAH